METKPHGNKDNKHAAKPDEIRKDATLYARCTTEQKNLIINYVQSKGKNPQQWIIDTLIKKINQK